MLIETRITARGKGSGIRIVETYFSVWTMEDGQAAVMEIHPDADQAFESAGLPAPGDT